jgi:hypothetical protein
MGVMKTSFWVSAVLVSLLVSGIPACGGKSDSKGGEGGAGGSTMEGLAGSGAGPATHASECETICERTKNAPGCTGETNSCLLVCATLTGHPSCQDDIDSWVRCAKRSTITCDESGMPSFDECGTEMNMVGACALVTPPPPAVKESCDGYCSEVAASGCSVDTEYGDCAKVCGITGVVVSQCQEEFVNYTLCQANSGITCDESGQPQLQGCLSESSLYLSCVTKEIGAGTSDL